MAKVTIDQIDSLTESVRKAGAALRGAFASVSERDEGALLAVALEAVEDAERTITAINAPEPAP